MLLCGVHLLPDLSGALIWPKRQLVAIADPIGDDPRQAPRQAAESIKRLAALVSQRRPKIVVWLGCALPGLLAGGNLTRRDADGLTRLVQAHDWVWVAEALPDNLPGRSLPELAVAPLVFRVAGRPQAPSGEVSSRPAPAASVDGNSWPCFVIDGRRLVMPAFGPRLGGVNVLAPAFQGLFRRPFQALMLTDGRILTRSRAQLQ